MLRTVVLGSIELGDVLGFSKLEIQTSLALVVRVEQFGTQEAARGVDAIYTGQIFNTFRGFDTGSTGLILSVLEGLTPRVRG